MGWNIIHGNRARQPCCGSPKRREFALFVLKIKLFFFYSQTGCSLASNIAIMRCNVAILMCKLLGANCDHFDKLLLKRYSSFLCLLQN